MKINNVTIPAPMSDRGTYKFDWPILKRNGQGAAVRGPYATITWTWDWLTASEYGYWATTLLAGAASATFTANTELYDDTQTLRTVSHCTVLAPSYDAIENSGYRGATITIDQIVMT